MRYLSKEDLIDDIRKEHGVLRAELDQFPFDSWETEGLWGDGWTLKDLISHLAEWQRMLLGWHQTGLDGERPAMPASGYKWSQLPDLNRAIHERHRLVEPADAIADFEAGYERIVELVESLTPEQILEPGQFAWTGKNALRTYIGANTASHYRFALKIIRRSTRAGRN